VPRLGEHASSADVWRALLQLWPSLVAFLGSFAAILIMWINHHGLFRMTHRVDPRMLYVNGFLLLLVTFVPFPTAVLAEYLGHPGERAAAAFYCGTFVVVSIAFNVWWHTATKRGLLKRSVTKETVAKIRSAYRFGLVVYMAAVGLSLWHAAAGLGACLSLWVLWAVLDYRADG
jgi:uncharacterized membrane protein